MNDKNHHSLAVMMHRVFCLLQVAAFVDEATEGLVLVAFGTSFQFNSWLRLLDYQGAHCRAHVLLALMLCTLDLLVTT
jgi:hypothetical protein